ncbi:MAG: flagellar basal body P-ring formation protein FlgA [Rhodospirillaceae bacterium]|nr:flagellar basal body P-ring formation protein FlgA [Rhodospirillaceae bacterium]
MMRPRLFALRLALAGLAAAALGHAAAADAAGVVLRSAVTVNADVIRLGDLFEGKVESAYVPVARAPAPGRSIVLDARWLAMAARAFKLDWRPSSRFDQAVVTRASKQIGAEAVKNAVIAALADDGWIEDISAVDFEFDPTPMELEVGTDMDATLGVEDLVFDERTGRFAAKVVVPAHGPAAASVRVSGQRLRLTDVPVLAVRRVPGDVIQAGDVKWEPVRSDRLGADVVLDPALIVGRTPRRPLRPDEPLRASDLDRVLTIRKGTLVTIRLQSPQMSLTVLGRALEDGAQGQPIRVMNTKSNRVVQGIVQDAGTVSVLALR